MMWNVPDGAPQHASQYQFPVAQAGYGDNPVVPFQPIGAPASHLSYETQPYLSRSANVSSPNIVLTSDGPDGYGSREIVQRGAHFHAHSSNSHHYSSRHRHNSHNGGRPSYSREPSPSPHHGRRHSFAQSHPETVVQHSQPLSHGQYLQAHQQHQVLQDHSSPRMPLPSPLHRQHSRFMYSKCTGKRKALCIGINYHGQHNELRGCINDAHNIQRYLIENWGYSKKGMIILTDDSHDPKYQPTRANIIEAIHWLVDGACAHDSLFFHYSGHGGQVPDQDGDEVDGKDEVIFPVDYRQKGVITDDLLNAEMVHHLPAGCRLTAIFDSCHSGSVLDLPYEYHTDGRTKGLQVTPDHLEEKKSPADVTSADTYEGKVAVGAMSYTFIKALSANKHQSYQQLLQTLRSMMRQKYSQKPQLSSSHRIDTNLQFIM